MNYQVRIKDVALGGAGVGDLGGKVVFVRGVLPGEVVSIKGLTEKKNFYKASLDQVIEPSPARIEVLEGFEIPGDGKIIKPVSYNPGYCYYYASYDEELSIKNRQFSETLSRIGEVDNIADVLLEPIASPKQVNYRNKITLHVEDDGGIINLGYIMADNHSVLDLPACPLADEKINHLLADLRSSHSFKPSLKDGMKVIFRTTENGDAIYWRNSPERNATWLKEETVVGEISVPQGSFFQVNKSVSNIVVEKIITMLKEYKPDTVVDLYCGCGIFSIAAATIGIGNVIGIDNDQATISAAEYNAKKNNFTNCTFHAGNADKITKEIISDVSPDNSVLVVDPPRNGMGRATVATIINSGIKKIIYVSCAPDTLGRDIRNLKRAGFVLKSTQLADMFPRTAHFESISVLERC